MTTPRPPSDHHFSWTDSSEPTALQVLRRDCRDARGTRNREKGPNPWLVRLEVQILSPRLETRTARRGAMRRDVFSFGVNALRLIRSPIHLLHTIGRIPRVGVTTCIGLSLGLPSLNPVTMFAAVDCRRTVSISRSAHANRGVSVCLPDRSAACRKYGGHTKERG